MAKEQVTVPDIGGGEAEVIEVLVQVGDEISPEQGLVVLESDKASMEIPSTAGGKVIEVLVTEGQQLAEGAPILLVETEAADTAGAGSRDEEAEAETPEQGDSAAQGDEIEQTGSMPAEEQASSESESAGSEQLVPVPDIGTDDEVDLVEISVAVGDSVAEGDSLVVLESDKASMEVPSPAAGEVLEIRVTEGQKVKQGSEILVLRTAGSKSASQGESSATAAPEQADKPAAPEPAASRPAPAAKPAAAPSATPAAAKAYAGPAVRKLAREFGIDLSQVKASGPRGRIVKEDLHAFSRERMSAPAGAVTGAGIPQVPEVDFAKFGEVEVTERSKLDKLTAANMQRSWLNVPHVTQYDDADVTELEEFRASLKKEAEKRATRVTPLPFLLKACAVALRDNPKFLSSLADGGSTLVYKKYVHIGIAVDTPVGLLVPVIRDVDKKGIWELSEEVLDLADKARERKLGAAQMQGGCFTISSLGALGGSGFSPIINTPEVGILGVSRTRTAPVWDGSSFVPRQMLPVSLSYDHRVVNGADAGRFLTRLVGLLGDIRGVIL